MKKLVVTSLALAIAAGVGIFVLSGTPEKTADRGRGGARGPVVVTAEAVQATDVPVFLEGVGSARARNTITVRPQVDGRLVTVNFTEGQDVKKGDLLAKIDPITYQAQLDQALAKKSLDEALLANTKRDLGRYEKVGTLAISQQQIDTTRALIKQQEAQLRSDEAAIDNLRAILDFTNITSPIDGRAGLRLVDEGNFVRSGESSAIVTITEIKPIAVIFNLPQQQLPELSRANANGTVTTEAYATDRRLLLDTGFLQVIDNQVDAQTGTVKLKAEFPNDKLQLWPGQFVNIRVKVDTLKDVVVAPSAAIQRGPNGPFVFVIGDDGAAILRPVTTGHQDEKQAVITAGLKAGDMVVTSGFGRLESGSKVKIANGGPPAPGAPPAEPKGRATGADASGSEPRAATDLATADDRGAKRPGSEAASPPSATP